MLCAVYSVCRRNLTTFIFHKICWLFSPNRVLCWNAYVDVDAPFLRVSYEHKTDTNWCGFWLGMIFFLLNWKQMTYARRIFSLSDFINLKQWRTTLAAIQTSKFEIKIYWNGKHQSDRLSNHLISFKVEIKIVSSAPQTNASLIVARKWISELDIQYSKEWSYAKSILLQWKPKKQRKQMLYTCHWCQTQRLIILSNRERFVVKNISNVEYRKIHIWMCAVPILFSWVHVSTRPHERLRERGGR